MSGWIKLWRKIRDHGFWQEQRRFSKAEAWIDLLMDAAFEDHKVLLGNRMVHVKRGQVLFSARKKAAKWLWARNCVHAFFVLLEREQMVSREVSHGPEGGYTLLTVLNYEKYQGLEETFDGCEVSHDLSHDLSHGRATVEPRLEPSEEGKEGKDLTGDSSPVNGSGSKRPGRKQKATDPNVKLVIDAYHQSYLATHGTPPPLNGGKAGAIAKKLLAGRQPAEALWMVGEFFKNPPQYYSDRNLWGMEHILAAAPTLLARSTRPQP